MASAQAPQITPLHLSLRLKHNKHTILLPIDPLRPLTDLKRELLRALHLRFPGGSLPTNPPHRPTIGISARVPAHTSVHIPELGREEDVLLARPVDVNDASKGWRRLRVDGEPDADVGPHDDSASPAAVGKAKQAKSKPPRTAKEAGLKDGGVLAFAFRPQHGDDVDGHGVNGATQEDEGVGMEIDEEEALWDVLVPRYEDAVGVINEGELGGGGKGL